MEDRPASQAEQWGIPDWRDKAAYPQPQSRSMQWWKWQFCRRQPTYRELWREKVLPFINAAGKFDADAEWKVLEQAAGPPRPGLRIISSITLFEREFGVHPPSDPRRAAPAPFFESQSLRIERALPVGISRGELEPHEIAIVYDTRFPRKPQLKAAERYLNRKELGWPSTRASLRLFPNYLRVLDADEPGASARHIAEVLLPKRALMAEPEETIRNWRRSARTLRDGGYRLL